MFEGITSQNVIPQPGASALPKNLLEMQIFGPCPRNSGGET